MADRLLLLFFRIGRMAGRLPKVLADDVVGSVLDCFRYVLTLMHKVMALLSYVLSDLLSVELFIRTPKPIFLF